MRSSSGSRRTRRPERAVGLALLVGLAFAAHAEPPHRERTLEALMANFAHSRGVEADFREEKVLPLLAEPLVSEGRFYFAPPDRLARFTETPGASSMLLDGNRLRIEDTLGTQEIDLGAEPTARQLVAQLLVLLSGDLPALERDYRVDFRGEAERWTLALVTRDLRARQVVSRIVMQGPWGRLDEMALHGAEGEVTRTRFERVVGDRVFEAAELARLFPAEGAPRPLPRAATETP